ncbi:hypothetical protein GCM10023324_15390 [Streptomyces youssoufiensis]
MQAAGDGLFEPVGELGEGRGGEVGFEEPGAAVVLTHGGGVMDTRLLRVGMGHAHILQHAGRTPARCPGAGRRNPLGWKGAVCLFSRFPAGGEPTKIID